MRSVRGLLGRAAPHLAFMTRFSPPAQADRAVPRLRARVAEKGRLRPEQRALVQRAIGMQILTRAQSSMAGLLVAGLLTLAASARGLPLERRHLEDVEANYIVNFVRYSAWPPEALASAEAPYVITVLGDDAVRAALEELAPGAAGALGRRIEVRALRLPPPGSGESIPIEAIGRTHVVFVGRLAQPWMHEVLFDLRDSQVLTIGAAEGFAAAGGMFELVRKEGRVLLETNTEAVRRSGIVVSARVLSLAQRVDG